MKKERAVKIAELLHEENMAIMRLICALSPETERDMVDKLIAKHEVKFHETVDAVLYEE